MRRAVTLLLLLASCAPRPRADTAASARQLALTDVAIVDVERGRVLPRMTVLISGNRIERAAPVRHVRVPATARTVSAPGAFLIPGLWDMHVHTLYPGMPDEFFPLFVASGVTGVRDLNAPAPGEEVDSVRREVVEGRRPGPRFVRAGQLIEGGPAARAYLIAARPEEGRRLVDSLVDARVDFIKVYNLLSPETYQAIARRARERGVPLVGHLPNAVRAVDAVDAGQRTIEHLRGLLIATSEHEAELRDSLIQAMAPPLDFRAATAAYERAEDLAARSHAPQKAAALFARFRAHQTWQVPTLVNHRGFAHMDDGTVTGDPRQRYLTPSRRWTLADPRFRDRTPEDYARLRRLYARRVELTGALHRAGVPLLAGTDAPQPNAFPGFGLHDELEELVRAGLTPLDALRAATLNPARFLGATDSLGTVAPGRVADLVLLDANPLVDIRNTRRIRGVVLDGRFFDRPALDSLLAATERAANRPAR